MSVVPYSEKLVRGAIRSVDIRTLPYCAILLLVSMIDRSNVGNARVLGLQKDLGLSDQQFQFGLMVFFISYILSELPSNLILYRVQPRLWLATLTVLWGTVVIGSAFVTGPRTFVAVRLLLGLAEGGLLPGIVYYLSQVYTRAELGLRLGVIYSAASLAGAFGGLLSHLLSRMPTSYQGTLYGWRWVMMIEGVATLLAGALAGLFLPNSPDDVGMHPDERRALDRHRAHVAGKLFATRPLVQKSPAADPEAVPAVATNDNDHDNNNNDSNDSNDSNDNNSNSNNNGSSSGSRLNNDSPSLQTKQETILEEAAFSWSALWEGLSSLSGWLSSLAYFGILASLYSFGLFLPTLVLEMGVAGRGGGGGDESASVQLWTVVPYVPAAAMTVLVAYGSDRWLVRGPIVLSLLPLAVVGHAALARLPVERAGARFGMTVLVAVGLFPTVPCLISWTAGNSAGKAKRATITAVQLAVANCGGFVAAYSYFSSEKPMFAPTHLRMAALLSASWVLVALNMVHLKRKNRLKLSGRYDRYLGVGTDRNPTFAMLL